MGAAVVTVDTREVDALVRRLTRGAALDPQDRRQLLTDLGAELEDQTKARFSTKRAPDGTPWKSISEVTRAYYQRKFPGAQPALVVTGGLRDSVETQVQPWAVLVGATKEYAAVHQFGWTEHNIESRPYLGVGEVEALDLAEITTSFVRNLLSRKAG